MGAASIVGAYGGLVNLSTIVGAWLADRVAGSEHVLFASAVLIMLGHISLALLPGFTGLTAGLCCVALGSGGLKANATSLVGALYRHGDERRDAGFSLFYLGINLGAFVGPLLTGLAQQRLGFHYGFGLAAIGMAAGLTQYVFMRAERMHPTHSSSPTDSAAEPRSSRPAPAGGHCTWPNCSRSANPPVNTPPHPARSLSCGGTAGRRGECAGAGCLERGTAVAQAGWATPVVMSTPCRPPRTRKSPAVAHRLPG